MLDRVTTALVLVMVVWIAVLVIEPKPLDIAVGWPLVIPPRW